MQRLSQRILFRWFSLLVAFSLLSGCVLVRPTVQTLQLLAAAQAEGREVQRPSSATAELPAATPALLEMLRFVPNEPVYREWLTLGDVAAWYQATGMPRVNSVAEWEALTQPQRDWWAFDLALQTLPPDTLGLRYLMTEDLRASYGFSFFDAERFLEAGLPPGNFTVLATSAAPAQIEQALLTFGYTATAVTGGTLYSIRGDNEVDLQSPTRTGQLGQLNRIALLDDTLIIGRATELVQQVVATANHRGATLAADPIYQALTTALAAPAIAPFGQLVGAILLGQPLADDPRVMLDQTNEAGQAQLDTYARAPLPPYLALGFATQRTGASSALTLAVVFPPGVDGAAAAAILGDRLANYTSVVTQRPLADRWSLAQAVAVTADTLPVALVTLRVNTTAAGAAAHVRPLTWSDLIYARDWLFLTVGKPVRP